MRLTVPSDVADDAEYGGQVEHLGKLHQQTQSSAGVTSKQLCSHLETQMKERKEEAVREERRKEEWRRATRWWCMHDYPSYATGV